MRVDDAATITPAEYYDERHARGWMEAWPTRKRERMLDLIRDIGLRPNARVLEFGCGEGIFAGAVKAALPALEVHGCDISATGIAKARRSFPEVEFHRLSEDGFSAPAGAYDLVLTHHVLEHVQDLQTTLTYMTGLLRPDGKLLHVFPCGNEGSLEFRLAYMIKGGIGAEGLFLIDDCSHVRRLTSAELERASRRIGLTMRQAFFANQFWGGLEYLTGIYHFTILEWLVTFCGTRAWTSARLWRLLAALLTVSLMRQGPANALAAYRHPRPVWKRVLFSAAVPFAALAYPFSWLVSTALKRAGDRKWRRGWTRPDGSEAYLLFGRLPGASTR
jgi:SAM-dependent methyltransferase